MGVWRPAHMPMNDRPVEALNAQITHVFNASYIYLGMAAYFGSMDLDDFAGWMRAQSASGGLGQRLNGKCRHAILGSCVEQKITRMVRSHQ